MDVADLDPDPLQQVRAWRDAARSAGAPVADAMTLATVTAEGHPVARMVVLRGVDRGLVFFTDFTSDKAQQLAGNPRAALVLHWHQPVQRQVRVTGTAEVASDEEADRYWQDRPRTVKLAAVACDQSRPVANRAEIEQLVRDLGDEYPEDAYPNGVGIPRPGRWRGFRIVPDAVEFWEERRDAIHDRIRFRRGVGTSGAWIAERLYP